MLFECVCVCVSSVEIGFVLTLTLFTTLILACESKCVLGLNSRLCRRREAATNDTYLKPARVRAPIVLVEFPLTSLF